MSPFVDRTLAATIRQVSNSFLVVLQFPGRTVVISSAAPQVFVEYLHQLIPRFAGAPVAP
ncbi:hypothetical protein [uncultured Thiodictyon sp.]|jgi:hypothetical protein|uniref:hypothetical protein n=1 Tax=uncultured Thiodictyon sp. TaxID=1846217 RepID=UPI0025F13EAB|nr:hypothetical protein [uncultured Thiodictyon sp.]